MSDINVRVRWDGREVERGARSSTAAIERMIRSQRMAAETAQALAGSTGRLTGALATVTAAISARGGVTVSLQSLGAQAASVGALFGPQGAIVGAVVGSLVPALTTLAERLADAESAFERVRRAGEEAARVWRESEERARQMRTVEEALARPVTDITARDLESLRRIEREITERRFVLEAQAREARLQHEFALAQSLEGAAASLRAQHAAIVARRDLAAVLAQEQQTAERLERAERALAQRTEERATRARARRARTPEPDERRTERAVDDLERLFQDAITPRRDAFRAMIGDLLSDIERAEQARRESMERAMEESNRRLLEEQERARAILEERQREFAESTREVTGVITSGVVDSIAAIIAGQKSAEQAFLSLLGKFLEWIATKATLKAADEYAEAVAAYARYDYSAGAQHTAAGVAFTALAVAAGAGAIGIAASQASAPPQGQSADARGITRTRSEDRTIVIEMNAPIVTAQTRAELGRDIERTIEAGEKRFGARRVR